MRYFSLSQGGYLGNPYATKGHVPYVTASLDIDEDRLQLFIKHGLVKEVSEKECTTESASWGWGYASLSPERVVKYYRCNYDSSG